MIAAGIPETVVVGIDAARRAGWAKFYEAQRNAEVLEHEVEILGVQVRFYIDVVQRVFDGAVADAEELAHLHGIFTSTAPSRMAPATVEKLFGKFVECAH